MTGLASNFSHITATCSFPSASSSLSNSTRIYFPILTAPTVSNPIDLKVVPIANPCGSSISSRVSILISAFILCCCCFWYQISPDLFNFFVCYELTTAYCICRMAKFNYIYSTHFFFDRYSQPYN